MLTGIKYIDYPVTTFVSCLGNRGFPSFLKMDYSSDDDSEISDSEIDEYEGKIYESLMSGDVKANSGESYSCLFCSGKKKKDYTIHNLLQHASGVGAAPNRPAKDKATHRALAKYLKDGLAGSLEPQPQLIAVEPQPLPNRNEKFVWPWMGVVANVPTEWKDGRQIGESGSRLKEQLSHFCPLKVIPLWTSRGHTGNAIVEFGRDWNGFRNALAFEKYFEAEGYGKSDWKKKRNQGSNLFGWVARAEDHCSPGLIGDHLRKNADLKTITDLENEGTDKNNKLVANLANQIEVKNQYLQELEFRYNETAVSLEKMMAEREKLLQAYNEEIRKMQQLAHKHSQKIIVENQNLRSELESKIGSIYLLTEDSSRNVDLLLRFGSGLLTDPRSQYYFAIKQTKFRYGLFYPHRIEFWVSNCLLAHVGHHLNVHCIVCTMFRLENHVLLLSVISTNILSSFQLLVLSLPGPLLLLRNEVTTTGGYGGIFLKKA
uniref:Uncharacterized protein n=1 Tax=Avena sativa TaxID=4498 RepID=A0ACD6ATI7_AVESA